MHVPALAREALEFLNIRGGGTYIDATMGGAGHGELILARLNELGGGRLLGIDRDPAALQRAGERLRRFEKDVILMHGNFANIDALYGASGLPPADGILADLGFSSWQIEDPARGFSFERPGPLDMRLDPGDPLTAGDIVNKMPEQDLADLIFEFGEERHSRRIARAIVKARPVQSTVQLAKAVRDAIPSRAGLRHLHPATRTFMALRLAVNQEIDSLDEVLAKAPGVLAAPGRLVVISFHSLEDRKVKRAFAAWSERGEAEVLTRKVTRPSAEEILSNPRARSAKLRAAEKRVA